MPVLKVEFRGTVLVMQIALLDQYVTDLHIKKTVDHGLARRSGLAGLRLVGRAVGVDDQVQLGVNDLQVA